MQTTSRTAISPAPLETLGSSFFLKIIILGLFTTALVFGASFVFPNTNGSMLRHPAALVTWFLGTISLFSLFFCSPPVEPLDKKEQSHDENTDSATLIREQAKFVSGWGGLLSFCCGFSACLLIIQQTFQFPQGVERSQALDSFQNLGLAPWIPLLIGMLAFGGYLARSDRPIPPKEKPKPVRFEKWQRTSAPGPIIKGSEVHFILGFSEKVNLTEDFSNQMINFLGPFGGAINGLVTKAIPEKNLVKVIVDTSNIPDGEFEDGTVTIRAQLNQPFLLSLTSEDFQFEQGGLEEIQLQVVNTAL